MRSNILGSYTYTLSLGINSRTVAFMQYLGMPLGPSSKTCPKCILVDKDLTSVLFIPYELSGNSYVEFGIGAVNDNTTSRNKPVPSIKQRCPA